MNSIIADSMALTLRMLRRSRLRTFLSVVGIAIGIASIIVIMSAGLSLRKIFDAQLAAFGTDYIQIEIKVPNTGKNSTSNGAGIAQGISVTTLTLDDKRKVDNLGNVRASYAAVLGQSIVTSLYDEKRVNYMAVSSEFPRIDTTGLKSGQFFSDEDERGLAKVVVLGSDAAKKLFPGQDPLGQSIKVQKQSFRVVGVMNARGSTGFVSLDDWIFVPLRTAQKLLLGFDHVSMIFAQLKDVSQDIDTAADITAVLRAQHDITDPAKDDFAVTTQAESQGLVGTILSGITLVLGIIASIALLVGGVGIMNIMYVAVNERVFEIGLRKAVGARVTHIKTQFLVEAIVITLIGGIFGLIMAAVMILAVYGIANASGFDWPFAISVPSIAGSIFFSSLIGLTFGYYPAKRASELRPVEALAHHG